MEHDLPSKFYHIIVVTFCIFVVISNVVSAKLFTLPFFPTFCLPCGLITYPFTFILSDLVTELYGSRKAKFMVYTAIGMTLLTYLIIKAALAMPAYDVDNHELFLSVLGSNGLIIFASLAAYVLSQLMDIKIYAWIMGYKNSPLWLRNNGSTLISQIVDTLTVNLIHLYWGLGINFSIVWKVMLLAYIYKAVFSLANTPIFYFLVYLFKKKRLFLVRNYLK